MHTIIAGRFKQQDQANRAVAALEEAGFERPGISVFFVNPSGQHDLYPVGGDANNSPGAHEAPSGAGGGAAVGGAIGGAVGLMAAPFLTPAAALVGAGLGASVGAYTGTLAGALSKLGHPVEPDTERAQEKSAQEEVPLRKSGMLVAVSADTDHAEGDAIQVLRQQGAIDIEHAEGTISDGHWPDFDPLRPVELVDGHSPAESRPIG